MAARMGRASSHTAIVLPGLTGEASRVARGLLGPSGQPIARGMKFCKEKEKLTFVFLVQPQKFRGVMKGREVKREVRGG